MAPTPTESMKAVVLRAADDVLARLLRNGAKQGSQTEDSSSFDWSSPKGEASLDENIQIIEKLIGTLVKDIGQGGNKVTFMEENSNGIELDFSAFDRTTFVQFMEKSMHQKFAGDKFPDDSNTDIVLEKLHEEYIGKTRGVTHPTFIVDFPEVMSRIEGKEGKAARIDLIILGKQLVSLRFCGASVAMTLRTANISNILANLTDVQEVEKILPEEWKSLDSKKLEEVPELLEIVQDKVNDWYTGIGGHSKTQRKAMYVLSAVGNQLVEYIKGKLGTKVDFGYEVWYGPVVQQRKQLELSIVVCETWLRITKTLTRLDWKDSWEGPEHEDANVVLLAQRLEQILRLRNMHEQLAQLLNRQELQDLKSERAWDSFSNLNPLDVDPSLQPEWDKAEKAYEQRIAPIEQRSAEKLRAELSAVASNPQAMLQAFLRFQELIKRPLISAALGQERDTFLAKLSERINQLRTEFEVRSKRAEGPEANSEDRRQQAGRHMPGVLNNIVWVRQLRNKVEGIMTTSKALLSDLGRFQSCYDQCTALLDELKEFESDTFDTWCLDIQGRIGHTTKDAPLTLKMQGSMMEIAQRDGKLVVNYNERLVELIREVRQLMSLGYAIPVKVQKVAQDALKFYRHAMVLKQVANFYNTLDRQLIPSTITILERNIAQFEDVVKAKGSNQRNISWNNEEEAENYRTRLLSAAEALTTENRKLRKCHGELIELTKSLMTIDLVKHMDKWKIILKEMRGKFDMLERQDCSKQGLLPWKRHWDHQLYKAMEHQYQRGLETLNESLPEINISLCFKQGQIQFEPAFERVRELYYKHIRDFIAVPMTFKGVGESEIFKLMPERNEKGIVTVFTKAEALFSRLSKICRDYKDYVILGLTDLDQWVDKLTDVAHWEMNFKMLKAKGKHISSLENTIKRDCFCISTAPIKASIEDHLARLADLLNHSLKVSAEEHVRRIDTFLQEALAKLAERPTTLEDIGKANKAWQDMKDKKPAMEAEMKQFEAKNRLLKTVAGSTLDSTALKAKWERFDEHHHAHEQVLASQIEAMRSQVDGDVQKYFRELERFVEHWKVQKPKDISALKDHAAISKALELVKERKQELDDFVKRGQSVTEQCQYFKMDEPDMTPLREIQEDVESHVGMWGLYEGFQEQLEELKKEDWITFRSKLFRFDDFIKEWAEKLRESATNDIVIFIREQLDKWALALPLLKLCRGEGMTPDHWAELFRLVNIDRHTVTVDQLVFGHFLDRMSAVASHEKELKDLDARVQGEVQIRTALAEIRAWAHEANFSLSKPQKCAAGTVCLVKEWKEILTQFGDKQSLLNSLKDFRYYQAFAGEASSWEQKFGALDEYLHLLMQIQRKWVYLEPIFSRGALPQEQPRFRRVDKSFTSIMKDIEGDPRVIELAKRDIGNDLKSILEQLDRCQKALNEFLEQKRDKFPRFYFIGDDDLLEILGQAQNPAVIQSHLKKLFSGINKVAFDEKKEHIMGMISLEGEEVPLITPVQVTAEVEVWLSALDQAMRNTLKQLLSECVSENDFSKFPSQLLCLAEQIHFTSQAEAAIQGSQLEGFKQQLLGKLKTNTESQAALEDRVSDLKMKSIVMDLIHSIDVVEQLIENKVKSCTDWYWQKQLRFTMVEEEMPCKVHMVDATFDYTFEYQGNVPKLVHTPLTDKCYLTLTQGMHLGYGGNPYGPAGTGKTESVKALGNALGRQVLVFNCDEGIDFKSMGRIFVGLVKCGAWGCFDEFNRLKEDQLSAISQMIQVIQAAIKNKEPECDLLNRSIDVNHNAGIFVTLNPAGKGYGGRSKLPDNLKQLFRAVAMSVPDLNLIAETILRSEGFLFGRELSRKIITTFTLCRQLLSKQQHYDWGLRAIKTCLSLAGRLVQQWRKDHKDEEQTIESEQELVIQSLRVNTLSKLAFDDTRLFNGLIHDIFPGVSVAEIEYESLLPAINQVIADMKLQRLDGQIQKVLQLYEALKQRMGVVIVGPSGSGKSTLLRILRAALEKLKVRVPLHVMNPKAMPRNQLLGYMDMDTREWSDGVLTAAARRVVKEPTDGTVLSWILCDGDIDPEWVESLNSVLDDNKLLTMPNGERIQFGPNVNFVFETHSLSYASPATVSRMGMIFLSEEDVDPHSTVATWLLKQDESHRANLEQWLSDFFYKAIHALEEMKGLVVHTTRMGIVCSGLSHLSGATTKQDFTIGLIRGLGSFLPLSEREDYARTIFDLVGERPPQTKSLLDIFCNDGKYVKYEYDPHGQEITMEDLKNGCMVNTVDVQRHQHIINPWLRTGSERPFLLVGPEGAGKSSTILTMVENLKGVRLAVINCSSQTEALHVQQKLMQMCMRLSTSEGPCLRPKDCERLILLLKDINLPKPDKYGTVQVHSFLQQLVLYSGFYDKDLEWIRVERVQIVCTMNPAGSVGRYDLAPRFVAIISVLSIGYPDKDSLSSIYTEYIKTLLSSPQMAKNSSGYGSSKATDLARVMCTVYEQVQRKYTIDDASHYIFNPRDLTQWVMNLQRYDLENNDFEEVVFYEGQRIFADRLTKTDHRKKIDSLLTDQMSSVLGYTRKERETEKYFISWLTKGILQGIEYRDFKKQVNTALIQHEREIKALDLVMLPEVLAWVARVDRVLSTDGGSMLLCGRAGVGRRQVVSICAYSLRMPLIELKMTRDFGMREFKAELKNVLQLAGVNGEHVVLFIEDHNIVDPGILELVNSLLAGGEAPGVYTPEELEPLLNSLKEEASKEGFLGGVYPFFVSRVRRFLHIAVSMDYTNPNYEFQCQSNPSLYARTSVLWLGTWSSSGMKRVPELVCKDVVRSLQPSKEKKDEEESKSPRTMAVTFDLPGELYKTHTGMGEQATPRVFRYFLENFQKVWHDKVRTYEEMRGRLQNGLAKLQEASESVDKLKEEAEQKQVILTEKQKEADTALTEIQQKMEEAFEQKKEADVLKQRLGKEKAEIAKRQDTVKQQLSQIEPVLNSAKEAVGSIEPKHLNEIRVLSMPPAAIRDVLEGVLSLMGICDTSWNSMKKFLGQRGVKDRILNFDARQITDEVRDNVKKLVDTPSFKHEVISRASVAAAPLAAWVRANIEYSTVLVQVGPLQKELEEAEEKREKAEKKLAKTEKAIKKLEEKVDELKKNFAKMTADAESLRRELDKAESMLKSARELLGELSGENTRWAKQVAEIDKDIQLLPKRCLIAAGFLTYLAKSSEDTRAQKVEEWSDRLGVKEPFSFSRFMRREKDLLQYKSEGLPADELSMQNAVMLLDAIQTPLFIDPASQATKWLREHLNRRPDVHVDYTTPADDRFAHTLELAVRFGKILIVAECDGIDPMLYPILRKDLISQGPKKVVAIGDKLVDWQETFKLYLVTRQPDLVLPPDAQALCTEVNFSITREGLEGQLLGITINSEQPDLERRKQENLEKEDSYKTELANLEEKLLTELSQAEGSLLENQALVDALTKIKNSAAEITKAVTKLRDDTEQMDKERNMYRPFAKLGSKIFFLIEDMPQINHMYQFGLHSFTKTFSKVLEADRGNSLTPGEKIKSLSEKLLSDVYTLVARGLFKDDRLLFGMHLVQGLSSAPPYDSLFEMKEWNFLVTPHVATTGKGEAPSWVDQDSVANYHALKSELPALESKIQPQREADTWYRWMQSPAPEADIPSHLKDLSPFQKLLLVQTFRPDRLISAMDAFVRGTLKLTSLTPPEINLAHFAELSEPTEAILMVTTPGADPSLQVEEMAFHHPAVGRHKFVQIAMGGGQTDEAIAQLRKCAAEGKWLLLKNLHLVISWVSTLEKELNHLAPDPNFRLWLTTEPHDKFPTVLATSSTKVTFEAPPGIKKSLLRTYENWTTEFLKSLSPLQCQILFNLAWFHGMVLERRTYVPQGWCKFYEFSPADLRSAGDVIIAQTQGDKPDWETIHGVLENAIYGGRMDNDFDVRLLVTYLKQYFNEDKLSIGGKRQQPISKGVMVPLSSNQQDFLGIVNQLPEMDYPSTFGLPLNADRTVQKAKVRSLLHNLTRLKERVDASKLSRSEWVDRLAPITQQWTSLCTPHAEALARRPHKPQNPGPIEGFVFHELQAAHHLVEEVNDCMEGINKVIQGTALITSELQRDASSLIANEVPERWLTFEGPETTSAFLQTLVSKAVALSAWQEKAQSGQLLNTTLVLKDLLRPQTFLNALRQQTSRVAGLPLVSLKLACSWNGALANCKLPVKVSKLFIQGAKWADGGLQECTTDDPGWTLAPDVVIGWVDQDTTDGTSFVSTPVYLNQSRATCLCELRTPCSSADVEQWILAGLALALEP